MGEGRLRPCPIHVPLYQWDPTIIFEAPTDLVSEVGEHVPEGTDLETLQGAEGKCGHRLAITEHEAVVIADFGGSDPVGEHQLALVIGELVRDVDGLLFRADAIQDRLLARINFGKELGWDYDSEEEGDPRIIKSSGTLDFEISTLECEFSHFRLKIRSRCTLFLSEWKLIGSTYRGPLFNLIWDVGKGGLRESP